MKFPEKNENAPLHPGLVSLLSQLPAGAPPYMRQCAAQFFLPVARHVHEVGYNEPSCNFVEIHVQASTILVERKDTVIEDDVVYVTADDDPARVFTFPVQACRFYYIEPLQLPQIPFCKQ
jgi:hypothetical protein